MATFRYSEIKKTKEEETIRNAQNGCRESMTLLCQEYEPLIAATAARFSSYHRGVEYDDAYQQSSLYFIECVRNYSTKEATTHKGLRYWAAKCVPPRMIDFWKTRTTIHAPHAHCPGTDAEKVTAARNSRNFSVIESRSSGRGESINSYPFMADRKQKAPEDIAEDNDYIDAVSDVVSSFSDRGFLRF